jgi:hypothetical protein
VRFDKEYVQTYFNASVGSVLPEAHPKVAKPPTRDARLGDRNGRFGIMTARVALLGAVPHPDVPGAHPQAPPPVPPRIGPVRYLRVPIVTKYQDCGGSVPVGWILMLATVQFTGIGNSVTALPVSIPLAA